MPFLEYSSHQVALGRSGRRQALRQFHLQLSHRKIFLPMAFLILRLILCLNGGFSGFILNTTKHNHLALLIYQFGCELARIMLK